MPFLPAGDAQLCAEAFGDPAHPAVLLIAGASCSMDWWEEDFCAALAARGRRVVRYDHRDTGRSTSYPPGAPGYTGADLAADAVAVLDGLGIERAHVAGLSMGGGIAQELGLRHHERVATLTLLSTSPVRRDEDLPGPSPELAQQPPDPDWSDREAVIEHLVAGDRLFTGRGTFDPERTRRIAARVVDRTRDPEASANHWRLADGGEPAGDPAGLAGIPTLVIHGAEDPLFPPEHGRALAARIPGARLLELEGVGHQYPPPHTWPVVLDALAAHPA